MENRIVISHNPFTHTPPSPFDIEIETFSEWARLLREYVKPQVMMCGHTHKSYVTPVGGELDHKGQPCPVIVGSEVDGELYVGGAYELYTDRCSVKFVDMNVKVKDEVDIAF